MQTTRIILAGGTLGFALSGFFDGILLHQILQWHHLLSLVPGIDNLRQQILWDGWFHLAMYGFAVAGLVGLWRTRNASGFVPTRIAGALLAGFGVWHVVDAVLSHWLLGIHRIRLDSAYPLLWDLGWLALFGIVPLLAGLGLLRRPPSGPAGRPRTRMIAMLALLALGAGTWSLRPAPGMPVTAVVFRADVSPDEMTTRLENAGAKVIWADLRDGIAIVDLPSGGWRLYAQGALLVAGSGLPAGCFGWSRT